MLTIPYIVDQFHITNHLYSGWLSLLMFCNYHYKLNDAYLHICLVMYQPDKRPPSTKDVTVCRPSA